MGNTVQRERPGRVRLLAMPYWRCKPEDGFVLSEIEREDHDTLKVVLQQEWIIEEMRGPALTFVEAKREWRPVTLESEE